jgi:hypothetical protein
MSNKEWLGHGKEHGIVDSFSGATSMERVLAAAGSDAECFQRAAHRVDEILVAVDHRLPMTQQEPMPLAAIGLDRRSSGKCLHLPDLDAEHRQAMVRQTAIQPGTMRSREPLPITGQ